MEVNVIVVVVPFLSLLPHSLRQSGNQKWTSKN